MHVQEGSVRLEFEEASHVTRYDEWSFFRERFKNVAGGSRGVDVVCVAHDTSWLVEVKQRTRYVGDVSMGRFEDAIADASEQARDTLAGLAVAARSADGEERRFATEALRTERWRVALHLEQADKTSRLHPQPYDVLDATNKLRQLVRAIDPRAVVVDSSNTNPNNAHVPWKGRRSPTSGGPDEGVA